METCYRILARRRLFPFLAGAFLMAQSHWSILDKELIHDIPVGWVDVRRHHHFLPLVLFQKLRRVQDVPLTDGPNYLATKETFSVGVEYQWAKKN